MMQNIQSMMWSKKSQIELWFHNLRISSLDIIRYTTCFGVGFLAGLLCKRLSKYIILTLIFSTILFAILQNCSIITINLSTLQGLTGIENITDISAIFGALVNYSQKHTIEIISSSIGFILGFKTG